MPLNRQTFVMCATYTDRLSKISTAQDKAAGARVSNVKAAEKILE